jgi:phosphoenolpyruvate-protein kinase (PTS system EI component)
MRFWRNGRKTSQMSGSACSLILRVEDAVQALPDNAILIADQLSPSQTAGLDKTKVVGFATVGGGATSHVAILARALGLPAMCGLPAQVLSLASGTPVLLDAEQGELHVRPSEAAVAALTAKREQQRVRQARDLAHAALRADTRDGRHIEVSANIASLAEAEQGMSLGGEGVGLLRSGSCTWTAAARRATTNRSRPIAPSPVRLALNTTWWCARWMSAVTNRWPTCR